LEKLASALDTTHIKVLKGRPLLEVAQHLAACQAYIGHDSGISHLAAALGLKGLILWGETNPNIWRPRSPKMKLLEAGPALQHLKAEKVLEAFDSVLR